MSEVRTIDTLEYVRVTVSEGGVDITGDDVQLAFVVEGTAPVELDWEDADWEVGGPPYVASILVGPGGVLELTEGKYEVWVRVTDNPEIPVRAVFRLIMLPAWF